MMRLSGYHLRIVDACLLLLVAGTLVFGSLASMKPLLPAEIAYLQRSEQPEGLGQAALLSAFSAGYFGQWQPLAWLSHELDYEIYGENLRAHRITSLIVHLFNTLLLFLLLRAATGQPWLSLAAAAVFALHPLHLEAVTAPAGRPMLLGTLFLLLALAVYGRAARAAAVWHYMTLVLLFVAAVLSTPTMIVLPLLLLLCDLWPLGRLKFRGLSAERSSTRGWVAVKGMSIRALLMEKVPLFLIAATLALFSILASREWYSNPFVTSSDWRHAALDSFGWLFLYLGRALWPLTLSAFYASSAAALPYWQGGAALLLLAAVSIFVTRKVWRLQSVFVGWFWFLIALFPHLPLVHWGALSGADSAVYAPLIGLIVLAVWGLHDVIRRSEPR